MTSSRRPWQLAVARQVPRNRATAGISAGSPISMATTGRRCAWRRPTDSRDQPMEGPRGRHDKMRTMSGPTTGQMNSADGTSIAFDRYGEGPVIILARGAFTGRAHTILSDVAAALAPWFTVVNYDRRGRSDSGDTQPYAVERELEDLTALLGMAGGSAMVFGGSSGAGLGLQAAPENRAI